MPAERQLKWEVNKETGCWEIVSHAPLRHGYRNIRRNGKRYKAQRWVWQETYGPIPPGICVLHRCDNPACINPDHLFLGTMTDNIKDRDQKGRTARQKGEKHGGSKLVEKQVKEIRRKYIKGVDRNNRGNGTALAKEYGITRGMICCIIRRKNWRHIA